MSEEKVEAKEPEAAAPKKGGGGAVVGIVLTVLCAAGASFAGAKFGSKGAAGHGSAAHVVEEIPPPGPTLALEPFLVNTFDASRKPHAMKVTLALEFSSGTKEEVLKPLIPRVRDAALAHLRTVTFEQISEPGHEEKARTELLEKFKHVGANGIQRVLVTDLVVQ